MTIDLQKFCGGEDELRAVLRSPFRTCGRIAATNGHLIVAIDDDGREGAPHAEEKFSKSHYSKLKVA